MKNIYVINDKLAESVGALFEAENDLTAYRMCKSTLSKVPPFMLADLELVNVGIIDGLIMTGKDPVIISLESLFDDESKEVK